MAAVEEKSMVPTILVGIGGTGHEVLSRVRRLVEETYGDLKNFPLISFLVIDTDRDYKVSNPEAAGSAFKDNEKHWASVTGKEARNMVADMGNFPWINQWFPRELERNLGALEAGAGQIRACGRFAFFCNYHAIQQKFNEAAKRIKGRENFMLDRYGIKVSSTGLNVFVTGSISGGTGSGMLIDLGYAIRHWVRGEASPLVTAIVPMPNAFAGMNVGDRVLANGYAALMELSYFSDYRTEYHAQFSNQSRDSIRTQQAPFDFTYLVGTKNGEGEFKLDQIREMIGQNIFLDLTSDFSPHKRSIRDNIKSAWAAQDPGGRGYPKNFMSFGLSTIEIPIAQIRTSLSNRLATDFINWWLNESVQLPPQIMDLVQTDILKRMRLTDAELLADVSSAGDKPYVGVISNWVNEIRNEIAKDNLLQSTQQSLNILGAETGKILKFVDGYLQPKVEEYISLHLNELSPDERVHGDFLQKMYDNRNQIIIRGRKALEEEFYRIVSDRTRGLKFADAFVVAVRQLFTNAAEKFRREAEKVWQPNEVNRRQQYEKALQDITHFKSSFGITKQAKMEEYAADALQGLEGSLAAIIQRKARFLGLDVIARMQEHLELLERRLNRLNQKLRQFRDNFKQLADRQIDSADALFINGLKIFDRQEINSLYQDLIEQLAGANEGSKSRYELGMNQICSTLSEDILKEASPLWKENRTAGEVMQLFDLTQLADVKEDDFTAIVANKTHIAVEKAPDSSILKRELAAGDRLFKVFQNNQDEVVNNIRIAYQKSKPLILLSRNVLAGQDAGFTPALNIKFAIIGGRNTVNPAAQKIIPLVQEFIGSEDAISPLGTAEQHRLVFVQEIGGFSLRCIDGMPDLRQSYQDWQGQTIEAKRARLRGENRDLPIPVHIQKDPPFWDIFPENPEVFNLVLQARALGVLRVEENRALKETLVRYTRRNAIGSEDVDLAASWEETVQVLEIPACRNDREEIQRQVNAKLAASETEEQKRSLYIQLTTYLQQRETELAKEGGKDSFSYKREYRIILDAIAKYKLNVGGVPDVTTPPAPVQDSVVQAPTVLDGNGGGNNVRVSVFCTSCGTKNPANSKFCSNCGTKLLQMT